MAKDSLAHNSHPDLEDRSGDLQHVGEIIVRVVLPTTKLRTCAGCNGRFRGKDLYEVPEDHLTFFESQELCRECSLKHGVL